MYVQQYYKYRDKYIALKGGKNHKFYYHGSSTKSDILEPHPSRVIDGEKAVFATNEKWLAVFFIAKTSDIDFELGHINGKPYILEQYHGAYNKLLKGVSGYLHYVDKNQFEGDKRLGMQNREFISKKLVKVIKVEEVNDVYETIKGYNIPMLTFEQKIECIEKLLE